MHLRGRQDSGRPLFCVGFGSVPHGGRDLPLILHLLGAWYPPLLRSSKNLSIPAEASSYENWPSSLSLNSSSDSLQQVLLKGLFYAESVENKMEEENNPIKIGQ